MSFDYFYGQQSDLFTFYRVPKVLFTNERFWNISADAKMLYGILLDRMSLSAKNGWIDKNGRVYIIFTIDEAKMALNCAEQKAIKLLSELEKKAGLIERKRQGLGKPNLIYVKNFISAVDSQLLNCENHNSGTMEILPSERAFAYKMKLDAIKHQGQRTDLTSSQVGMKLQAMDIVGQEAGESRNQVHRYIRLTELIPELLPLPDVVSGLLLSGRSGIRVPSGAPCETPPQA